MICSGSASHQLFQNDFRLRAKSLKRVGPIPPPPIPSLGRFCHEALRCPHFGSPDSRIELWLLWLSGHAVRHAERIRWRWLLPALRRWLPADISRPACLGVIRPPHSIRTPCSKSSVERARPQGVHHTPLKLAVLPCSGFSESCLTVDSLETRRIAGTACAPLRVVWTCPHAL